MRIHFPLNALRMYREECLFRLLVFMKVGSNIDLYTEQSMDLYESFIRDYKSLPAVISQCSSNTKIEAENIWPQRNEMIYVACTIQEIENDRSNKCIVAVDILQSHMLEHAFISKLTRDDSYPEVPFELLANTCITISDLIECFACWIYDFSKSKYDVDQLIKLARNCRETLMIQERAIYVRRILRNCREYQVSLRLTKDIFDCLNERDSFFEGYKMSVALFSSPLFKNYIKARQYRSSEDLVQLEDVIIQICGIVKDIKVGLISKVAVRIVSSLFETRNEIM